MHIDGAVNADMAKISFHYSPTPIKVVNSGHSIQVNYGSGSYIEVDGQRYDLLQFHFHSPSENNIGGRPFDMEVHMVHKNIEGSLAVVGVMKDAISVSAGQVRKFVKVVGHNARPVQAANGRAIKAIN